ncbi:MAG: Bax inhibitor-1/YccA family protein [Micrococcales bacterium]|nr:Bax inhibitor-1/YccA family protein [Micrococcales bacterium]MCL2666082.1 Bax inhibitor-1/YccA family protein [Micrococcales bacterium]
MSNPVFNNSPVFGDSRNPKVRQGRQQMAADPGWGTPPPGYQHGPQYQAAPYGTGAPTMDAASLESMYGAPSATNVQMRRMTYDDVVMKTGGLLALLVIVGAVAYYLTPQVGLGLIWGGMIAALGLGLVNAFKREPSPPLIIAYAVAEGVFLGGVSYLFQEIYVGGADVQPIVLQAVLATLATFGVTLALFRSGKVRVTPKFTRWLMIAIGGYALFSLLNFVLSFFIASEGFGPLRNGPVGIIVGLVAVGLAAASLIVDFDGIKRGVEIGAPAKYSWTASFGLLVTLVWLYFELLRLLAMFAGRD